MSVFRCSARAMRVVAPLCLQMSLVLVALIFASLQPVESAFADEPANQPPGSAETTFQAVPTKQSFVGNVRNRAQYSVEVPAPAAAPAEMSVPGSAPATLLGTVQDAWVAGYRDGGGHEGALTLAMCIIGKESGWNPDALNRNGPYYGLGQFAMSTWNAVGGGDWRDPYTQGVNFARNWNGSNPATQWPRAFAMCGGIV